MNWSTSCYFPALLTKLFLLFKNKIIDFRKASLLSFKQIIFQAVYTHRPENGFVCQGASTQSYTGTKDLQ